MAVTAKTSGSALIRAARTRHGLSQQQLALRAGTTQAAISRIESGQVSPTIDTLARLLFVMGERLELDSTPLDSGVDPEHLHTERSLDPAQRLERAFLWTTFNDALRLAGKEQSGD